MEKFGTEIQKLLKAGFALVVLIAIFFVFQILTDIKEYRYVGRDVYPSQTISVNGIGEVYAIPDIGQFTFTVRERADTIDEAQANATRKSNAVIEALESRGVEEKDIKTQDYYVGPRYEYIQVQCITFPCPGEERLVGYEVSQTMAVKVRDLETSGDLITAVTEAGATGVSNLSFTIDDMEAIRADARKEAIVDAREKAERLAEDLGVRLIRIAGFYEDGGYGFYEERAMGYGGDMAVMQSAAAPKLPTGENKITSSVSITYEIK